MERPHSRELQPQSYWLRVSQQAHVNMIGGVPKAVVCDNLGSRLTARADFIGMRTVARWVCANR
jgi:hypothetical protein